MATSPVPIVDFDPKGPHAHFHTLALLCGWTAEERRRRTAGYAAGVLGYSVETTLPLIGDILDLAEQGIQAPGSLRRLAGKHLVHEKLVDEFVSSFFAFAENVTVDIPDAAGMDREEVFWRLFRVPHVRKLFSDVPGMLRDAVWYELLSPNGGLRAMGEGPGHDATKAEIASQLSGPGWLAGLLLIVIAILAQHHPKLTPSVNRASYILGSDELLGERARGMRTVLEAWANSKALAPLWAGVIAATPASGIFDASALLATVLDNEKRLSAFSLAKWFVEFAGKHKVEKSNDWPIPAKRLIKLPKKIERIEPKLAPFRDKWLQRAIDYRAPVPAR